MFSDLENKITIALLSVVLISNLDRFNVQLKYFEVKNIKILSLVSLVVGNVKIWVVGRNIDHFQDNVVHKLSQKKIL